MSRSRCRGTIIAQEYAERYPRAGSRTLARMIVEEHPELFRSTDSRERKIEIARLWVRRVFGLAGGDRPALDARLIRPKRLPGVPESAVVPPTEPVQLGDIPQVAILADIHVPYHRTDLIDGILHTLSHAPPDCLIFLGDLIDCSVLSAYDRYGHELAPGRELEMTEQLLETFRAWLPKARIVWKLGNHEDRLRKRLGELGMADQTMQYWVDRLHLHDLGIEIVDAHRYVLVSGWLLAHGHEYGAGSGLHPAYSAWLRLAAPRIVIGHHHVHHEYRPPDWLGAGTRSVALGCLTQRQPYYATARQAIAHGWARLRDGVLEYVAL